MKGKNGVKLADFIREIINTKISEKPVKSRIFEDFKGIRKAPLRLLQAVGRRFESPLGRHAAVNAGIHGGFSFISCDISAHKILFKRRSQNIS